MKPEHEAYLNKQPDLQWATILGLAIGTNPDVKLGSYSKRELIKILDNYNLSDAFFGLLG